eukprot:7927152-Pyramimonas_sp.AAC.1
MSYQTSPHSGPESAIHLNPAWYPPLHHKDNAEFDTLHGCHAGAFTFQGVCGAIQFLSVGASHGTV